MARAHAIQKAIGERIRQRRLSLNWSQETLANKAGLHAKAIGRIETGNSNLTVATLSKLANAFDLEMGDLLGRSLRGDSTNVAEIHQLVDGAKPDIQALFLRLLRGVMSWEGGRGR